MKKNFYVSMFTFLVGAFFACASVSDAQTTRRQQTGNKGKATTTATATMTISPADASLTLPMPASDALMFVEVRRLLNEGLPRALASDPAKLMEVNADIEQFKQRTGLDARAFERVAIGVRFTNPTPDVTKIDHIVAVARGTFNMNALVGAGREAAKNQSQEIKHGGKTIYVFSVNSEMKLFGLFNMRVRELALTAIDANTLVIGEPTEVRAAIDASTGRGRIASELVLLARRTPDAIVGFGSQVPRTLLAKVEGFGNDEVARSVASIRQMYGSLGANATEGFDVLTVLRTATEADARTLNSTIDALKPLASFAVAQMKGEKGKLAQSALQSLRVTTQGNEVSLNLKLAQNDLAMMLRAF